MNINPVESNTRSQLIVVALVNAFVLEKDFRTCYCWLYLINFLIRTSPFDYMLSSILTTRACDPKYVLIVYIYTPLIVKISTLVPDLDESTCSSYSVSRLHWVISDFSKFMAIIGLTKIWIKRKFRNSRPSFQSYADIKHIGK